MTLSRGGRSSQVVLYLSHIQGLDSVRFQISVIICIYIYVYIYLLKTGLGILDF